MPKERKKKRIISLDKGKIYISSSFNNTIISVTDENGNIVSWATAGSSGFKGARKSTPYAAQIASRRALEKAKSLGLHQASVCVRGVGSGRESAVRALAGQGVTITSIKDTTPIPHNGARAKKTRRV